VGEGSASEGFAGLVAGVAVWPVAGAGVVGGDAWLVAAGGDEDGGAAWPIVVEGVGAGSLSEGFAELGAVVAGEGAA
jgi:hypothetical protein